MLGSAQQYTPLSCMLVWTGVSVTCNLSLEKSWEAQGPNVYMGEVSIKHSPGGKETTTQLRASSSQTSTRDHNMFQRQEYIWGSWSPPSPPLSSVPWGGQRSAHKELRSLKCTYHINRYSRMTVSHKTLAVAKFISLFYFCINLFDFSHGPFLCLMDGKGTYTGEPSGDLNLTA